MNKVIIAMCAVALLASGCSRNEDLYEGDKQQADATDKVAQNVESVFGTTFDANHDWKMIRQGQIKITPTKDGFATTKVQVLTGFPTKYGTALVLNEAVITDKTGEVVITFDAPDGLDTLFAACVNENGQYRAQAFAIGEERVEFGSGVAAARSARAGSDFTPMLMGEGESSDNAKKVAEGDTRWAGSYWNDKLYNTSLKVEEISDFNTNDRQTMNAIIQANVPEYSNNTSRIKASDIYINTSNYFTATGQKEIQITPVACGAWFCGWEQLYYYYFNPTKVEGMSDAQRAEYLQSLPKFKIGEVAETFANQSLTTIEEKKADSRKRYDNMLNRVNKNHTYTLAFFGEENNLNTQGTNLFPAGYQIGIMLRIDSLQDVPTVYNCVKVNLKNNEQVGGVNLYADRLLNNEVNYYTAWSTANLGKNMSRAAIFGANGKNYVGFEDLKDNDFNDVVFEVTGGVEIIDETLLLDHQVYTMAFEDTQLGDYDLNDVVIKAQRVDLTHVLFSLEATGAKDNLYLRNISGQVLNTTTEIHDIFGLNGSRAFVNTEGNSRHIDPVQELIEVPVAFTFSDNKYLPYIYNDTKKYEVKIARQGEDPHGIVIPNDFQYPLERICVGGNAEKAAQNKVAYKRFNNWGKNKVDATDWYKYPTEGLVYTKSVFKKQ